MKFKKTLIKFFSRYQYPHYIFSDSIKEYLLGNAKFKFYAIIDAPCGNGETSYQLSLLKNSRVCAYDISPQSIDFAKNNFPKKNIFFLCMDIYNLFNYGIVDSNVICLINSLFLLPDQAGLLKKMRHSMSDECLFFLIIPNVDGKNYFEFKKKNPHVNTMELSVANTKKLLDAVGFNVIYVKGIVYAHVYNRIDTLFLSVFASFYLLFLNYFQTIFKIGTPNYFVLVLNKK